MSQRLHLGGLLAMLLLAPVVPSRAWAEKSPLGDQERAALEREYQTHASPILLFKLGQLAFRREQVLVAQDFMRRYLAEPEGHSAAALVTEAEHVLQATPPPSGELAVSGNQGALLMVDLELRGILPLTLPLLLPPGDHHVVVKASGHSMSAVVSVEAGHRSDLRFEADGKTAVLSRLPEAVVLTDLDGLEQADQALLVPVIERALQRAGLWPYFPKNAGGRHDELPGCLHSPGCQAQLLRDRRIEWLVGLRLEPGMAGPTMNVLLFSQKLADVAATAEGLLDAGHTTRPGIAAATGFAELLDKVLAQGLARPHGLVRIESVPSGASVQLGTRVLGQTPLEQPLWVGPTELALRLPHYQTAKQTVVIAEQQTASVSVALLPEASARPLPSTRPRWRLALGLGTVGAGVLLAGIGAFGVAADGRCTADPVGPMTSCLRLYDTLATGSVLVGVGALAIVSGSLLAGWPPAASRRQ